MPDTKVIVVGGLPEKRRALAALNGTIDIFKRDRPEGWEKVVEYLEDCSFKVVAEEPKTKAKKKLGPRLPVFGRRI